MKLSTAHQSSWFLKCWLHGVFFWLNLLLPRWRRSPISESFALASCSSVLSYGFSWWIQLESSSLQRESTSYLSYQAQGTSYFLLPWSTLWCFWQTEWSIDKSKNYFTCFISFIREKSKKTKLHPLSPCTFRQFRESRWCWASVTLHQTFSPELNSAEGDPGIWAVTEHKCGGFCLKTSSVCGVVPQGKEGWPQQTDIL